MRPIAELTHIVRQIEAKRLQIRVGLNRWPQELTELARSFDAMLDKLDKGFRTVERFSADIAHELRTPISILRGETEFALTHIRTPQEYHDLLESNLKEYSRLERLVGSLLFLAQAEHIGAHIEKKTLDAGSEAGPCASSMKRWQRSVA